MWLFRRRRLLFRYYNGEKWVAADALRLHRKVRREAEELQVLAQAFDEGRDPEADEFVERVAKIFGLKRYDPETKKGLTDSEVAMVFADFHQFLEDIRNRFFSGSTSPQNMAGASLDSQASEAMTRPGHSP